MIRPWITLLLPGKSKISSRQAQQAKDRRLKTLEQLRWGFTASSPYCRCHSCFCCCPSFCFRWRLVLAVGVELEWQRCWKMVVAELAAGGRRNGTDRKEEKWKKRNKKRKWRRKRWWWFGLLRSGEGTVQAWNTHTQGKEKKNRKKEEGKSCRRWQDWSLKWPTPINKKKTLKKNEN